MVDARKSDQARRQLRDHTGKFANEGKSGKTPSEDMLQRYAQDDANTIEPMNVTSVQDTASQILANNDYESHPTRDTIPALAAIGHAWVSRSDAARRLADYMRSDEYWQQDDSYCPNAIRRVAPECDVDVYEIDSLMRKMDLTVVDKGGGESSYSVERDPDSVEHYRFAALGDRGEDADMGMYEESLRPLSWSAIGLMGVRDSSWNRQVGEDDAVAAVDDFGDVDLVSRE